MKKIFEQYCALPSFIRPTLWRWLHRALLYWDRDFSFAGLNYGFANARPDNSVPEHPDWSARQLYDYVVRDVDMAQKCILEVGSGRGAGAAFLSRRYHPKRYIGMDISKPLVRRCNDIHDVENLSFVQGNAESLPFPDENFDVVINIESARCYRRPDLFVLETARVLKPGGYFCFADMIMEKDLRKMEMLFQNAGLVVLKKNNILENVVTALKITSFRRKSAIDAVVPKWLRPALYEFAGVEGSRRFNSFVHQEIMYVNFLLKKLIKT